MSVDVDRNTLIMIYSNYVFVLHMNYDNNIASVNNGIVLAVVVDVSV